MTTPYKPIRRPSDVWEPFLLTEFRRLARLPDPIVRFQLPADAAKSGFHCKAIVPSFFVDTCHSGQDHAELQVIVSWLREGPKIADVDEALYQTLSQVEIRLGVGDFRMPFPTILVNIPPSHLHQYVILHQRVLPDVAGKPVPLLIAASCSPCHLHDIVTVCRHRPGEMMEHSLTNYAADVSAEEGAATLAAMRVACNLCLAMTNFGSHAEYLFPREVEAERKFIAKGNRVGRSGMSASDRLAEAPMIVTLDREVDLGHHEGSHPHGQPTGREMPFHWRRAHWRKLPSSKIVFIKACMVRADRLTEEPQVTTTAYK